MVQFIELTHENGRKYSQEIHHIIGVSEENNKAMVVTSDGEYYYVKETVQEILNKIADVEQSKVVCLNYRGAD